MDKKSQVIKQTKMSKSEEEIVYHLLTQGVDLHTKGDFQNAEEKYRDVLKLAPRNADAHHLLGVIYKIKNELTLAIESISLAISIKPNESVFYNNLGTCYILRQEFVGAGLCFEKALLIDKQYADAWCNYSLVLLEQERWADVQIAADNALFLMPNHEQSMLNKAKALCGQGRFDDSLRLFEYIHQLYSNSSIALFGMIECLGKLDRNEEALVVVETLLTLDSAPRATALQAKAGLLEVAGRIDEAVRTIDQAIELSPEQGELNYFRSKIRKVSKEEPFYNHIQRFSNGVELRNPQERIRLGYALGKAYEDVGEMDKASKFYHLGAQTMLESANFYEEEEAITAARIQTTCNSEYLQNIQTKLEGSDRSVLIVGMPRSGTTLTEQILGSHPAVFPAGELSWLLGIYNGFSLTPNLKLRHESPDYVDPEWTLQERGLNYLQKLSRLPGSEGKIRITDKMPPNYIMLGLTAAMLPESKIIHCRRDPIDTCISCYTTLFSTGHVWSYDLAALGRHFRRYWELMNHWRNVMPGRFLEIRYEDTVDDTESMARRLLEWVDLPWDERCLDFHKTNRPVRTASVGQVRQPIYASSKGRWKKWEPYIQPLLDEIGDLQEAYWNE